MADDNSDEFLPQDPADKLRTPSNSPFSLPGDEEPPAAGLEGMLVQAEIDAHIFDLKTLEKNSQKKSIQKMVDLGPSAVEPLCVYLKHPDRWARMMAAEVLGKIHDPKAIPALKEALNDQHQGVRYMSELALKEIASSTSLEQSSPTKGKEPQGKPPMPAKVTAKLHPVESRNRASSQKPSGTEAQKAEELEKPAAKPEPKPKAVSGLPEPNIPENLPEIKSLEPRTIPPTPAPIPLVQTYPQQTFPPPAIPPPSIPPVYQAPAVPAAAEGETNLPDDFFQFSGPEIAVVGIQSDSIEVDSPGTPEWSQEQSSACPVCHQQIKADTRVCPHCHAKFDVSLKGFCPNCRKSVEIDPFDHHCPRCGEEVIDQRYESALVAFGDINPGNIPIQKTESYQPGPAEGIVPSSAGTVEPPFPEVVADSAAPNQGEFPPIEVPALQGFAERYLGPEYEDESAIPEVPVNPNADPFSGKTPFSMEESVSEDGIDYFQPGDLEYPPTPEIPPLVTEPPTSGQNLPPAGKSVEEPARIRPMFALLLPRKITNRMITYPNRLCQMCAGSLRKVELPFMYLDRMMDYPISLPPFQRNPFPNRNQKVSKTQNNRSRNPSRSEKNPQPNQRRMRYNNRRRWRLYSLRRIFISLETAWYLRKSPHLP